MRQIRKARVQDATVMPMPIPILAPVDKPVEDGGGEGPGVKLNALLEIVMLGAVVVVVLGLVVLLEKGLD